MFSLDSLRQTRHARSGDGIAVPEHQRQIDRHHDRIGAQSERQRDRGQGQRPLPRLGRRNFRAGGFRTDRRRSALGLDQGKPRADVRHRRPLQLAQHPLEELLVGDFIFDDERRAFVIDAHALDPVLRLQPDDEGLGDRLAATELGRMKPQTARNEMTNSKVHETSRPVSTCSRAKARRPRRASNDLDFAPRSRHRPATGFVLSPDPASAPADARATDGFNSAARFRPRNISATQAGEAATAPS